MNNNKNRKNKLIGFQYEKKAQQFLLEKKYILHGTNLRLQHREIDILAIDTIKQETVIVEVKYREANFPHLSYKQQKNLLECGLLLDSISDSLPKLWRIDLIVFIKDKIYHYENIYLQLNENV
jgi:Holliday junction resolvase-like predicted endonuclease